MTDSPEPTEKVHHICQTYIMTAGRTPALKVDKLFQYSTARDAENRATREFEAKNCVGVDAYTVIEDAQSGEVSQPEFLIRLGSYPDMDE